MRKNVIKIIALGLAIVLLVGSVIPTYAYKVEEDEETYNIVVTGLEDGYISTLEDVAIESDLIMLDDIVERSYNNNFDVKSYIIKSTDKELDTTHWNMYLRSRGDIQTQAQFDNNGVVEREDDDNNKIYYHSITAAPYPEFDHFDWETRKVERWGEYINALHEAEKEIGYFEITDEEYKDNALCDYQLMIQTYAWMAENISYGATNGTRGQTAVEAVLDGVAVCAGYARLYNRFMHDFGIDSYWVSIPHVDPNNLSSNAHAANFVRLGDTYYYADTNSAVLISANKYNKNNIPLFLNFGYLFGAVSKDIHNETDYFSNLSSIINYNSIFVNAYAKESLDVVEPLRNKENTEYFEVEGRYDENCTYCGAQHYFPLGDKVIINDYSNRIVDGSYFFEAKYRRFDYDTWSYVYEPSFHIYEGSGADEAEKNHLCEELDNQIVDTTTEVTTTEVIEVPTKPVDETTTNIDTTTSIEELPTKPVETPVTTEEVTETPTTKVQQTTIAQNQTTIQKETTVTQKQTVKAVKTPGKPKSVTAKNKATKKIKVSWKKAINAKKYQVQWSTTKKFTVRKTSSKKTAKKVYTITKIKGKKLKKGMKYYVRVRAINGTKNSTWSKVKKVTVK